MLAASSRRWLGARLNTAIHRRFHPFLRRSSTSSTSFLSDATISASESPSKPQYPGSFETLARTFAAIEEVKNSRVAGVQLLADGYRQLLSLPTSQELSRALYLTAAQLAPPYEGMELRFGAKSFVRFLKQLEVEQEGDFDSKQTLEKLLPTYPDYGQATQALMDSGRIVVPTLERRDPLTIQVVHEQLMAIAKDEGRGGVARKQQLVLNLLQRCRCREERIFLVRMLAHQNLRIGMGEKSILSALAMASIPSHGDPAAEDDTVVSAQEKQWVDCVTLAYAQHPNYDVLAELVYASQHERNIARRIQWMHDEARPTIGAPVLTMSAYPVSSVAAVLDRVDKLAERTATCEYKYDGARVQVHLSPPGSARHVGRIFSRNMEDVTKRYSSLLDVLVKRLAVPDSAVQGLSPVDSVIVEGEVVALDRETGTFLPFQVLQTKITTDFCLFLFDLLAVDGTSLLQQPLRNRRDTLHSLFQEENGYLEFVKHVDISLASSGKSEHVPIIRNYLEQAVVSGCEGLMIKTLDGEDSEYKAGRRSYSWMKLKHDYLSDELSTSASMTKKSSSSGNGTFLADTLDLVPIGAFYGKGRRAGVFGSFLMAAYNPSSDKFETIGKVGTGFSDAQLSEVTIRLREQVLPQTDVVPEQYQSIAIRSRHPDVWLSPKEVWEIKATQLTESSSYTCGAGVPDTHGDDNTPVPPIKGLALRFPRFVQYRPDKKPVQATESDQVMELFNQQQPQIPQ